MSLSHPQTEMLTAGIIGSTVIVEVKSVSKLADVHSAQLLTYLRHTDLKVRLLFNFNSGALINGMKRFSL